MRKHPDPVMGSEGDVLGQRVVATILDALLLMALLIGGVVAAVVLGNVHELLALAVLLALAGTYLYYSYLLEGAYGRTPGKAVMGLVVVKEDGRQCTYGASFVRNLFWIVDGFGVGPFVVALILFVTDRHQRVGDIVASTVVVAAAD